MQASIKSRKHPTRFYFSLIFINFFVLVVSAGFLFMFLRQIKEGAIAGAIILVAAILAFLFLGIYTIAQYTRNSPTILVDVSGISFNGEFFRWDQIDTFALTGKQGFPYFFSFPMEGACFQFKNGIVKYLYDDMYANTAEIKDFINQTLVEKKKYKGSATITTASLKSADTRVFKGVQLATFRGIALWGVMLFFVTLIIQNPGKANFLIALIMGSAVFFFNSWMMNYMVLSDTLLVIKNHNLLWRNKAYALDRVKEVVFETRSKMPNCIRIITSDFRDKLYPASTLSTKTWLELKAALEQKGITVRDECISTN